jgi:D-alanyl-D-alanine endopeptidase (penicillin-binding protein 7)
MRRILSILVFLTLLYNGQSSLANSQSVPITATSWLVATGDGDILQSENMYQQRSIASITKLMTVMVVLDAHQDLNQYIKPYTRKELIQLAIVHSDNHAAELLCRHYPEGRNKCIQSMNKKAKSLGMINTRFSDPSGLGVMNSSTAYDLIKLVKSAEMYPEIVESSKMSYVKIKHKKKFLVFKNTNPLVATKEFIVSKTGYIRAAGGCIVMMVDTELGRRIVVLLNSKNTHTRIPEALQLAVKL